MFPFNKMVDPHMPNSLLCVMLELEVTMARTHCGVCGATNDTLKLLEVKKLE